MDLGTVEKSYEASQRFIGTSIFATILFSVFFTALLFLGHQTPPKDNGDVVAALFLVGGSLAGALLAFWNLMRWRTVRLEVCPQGIRYRRQNVSDEFRWLDVDTIQASITDHSVNGVYAGRHYHVHVKLVDGRRFQLHNSIDELGTVLERLQRECLTHLLANARDFGPISLTATGLKTNKRTLDWNEVGRWRLADGFFYISDRAGKQFLRLAYGKIPNAFVLLRLLKHHVP